MMVSQNFVMPALAAGIHVFDTEKEDVDGRNVFTKTRFANTSRHDALFL